MNLYLVREYNEDHSIKRVIGVATSIGNAIRLLRLSSDDMITDAEADHLKYEVKRIGVAATINKDHYGQYGINKITANERAY